MSSWHSQSEYEVRFEWGLDGAKYLGTDVGVIIIVDVLSFSTCVDIAVSNGAQVFPFLYKDERAVEYARSIGAQLASHKRSKIELCLSPSTMNFLRHGDKVVLPSPNGSSISFETKASLILCGSLRNASAVACYAAGFANKHGTEILVIAAGEKWNETGTLRPALEDQVGAGAILNSLPGSKSPEALAAIAVFKEARPDLLQVIQNCSSGKELTERGYPEDIELAAKLNASSAVPILCGNAFSLAE